MFRRGRLVIAGTHSGVGKTTVMLGMSQALRRRGIGVSPFKCGPDYLDPTYHKRATGRSCHNLDGWLMGHASVVDTLNSASAGSDLSLIEGVMGLFDGAGPKTEAGSAAQIAKWLKAPVILVVDASGMARSVRAVVDGFKHFDPDLNLAGVILNRVGSRRHLDLLREALEGIPVLGGFPKQMDAQFPERYLGLVTARDEAVPEATFKIWEELADEWLDLDAILELAQSVEPLPVMNRNGATAALQCRIGIAQDEAFSFYYEDNLSRLESLGATLVPFSPLSDDRLPVVDGLYFGGGYPEARGAELMNNSSMRRSIREFADRGGPVYGECGGMMYLCEGIEVKDQVYDMVGLLPGIAVMGDKLKALGYVEVETQIPSVLGRSGLRFRGHQFRYSELRSLPEGSGEIYRLHRRRDRKTLPEGYGQKNVLGSYVHAHWASNPEVAKGFVDSCIRFGTAQR